MTDPRIQEALEAAEDLLRELRIAHKCFVARMDTQDKFHMRVAQICNKSNALDSIREVDKPVRELDKTPSPNEAEIRADERRRIDELAEKLAGNSGRLIGMPEVGVGGWTISDGFGEDFTATTFTEALAAARSRTHE